MTGAGMPCKLLGTLLLTALLWVPAQPAVAACGDGIIQSTEQCDDGNLISGDGCSASCQAEVAQLVPGTGRQANCVAEWLTTPVPAMGAGRIPRAKVECTDDDPTCDFGPPGDGACTFHIAMCFNVTDSRIACAPSDVQEMRILRPPPAPRSATDAANRTALETVVAGIGAHAQGVCVGSGFRRGCGMNSDCDSAPASGDGVCLRTLAFQPRLTTGNQCTAAADITVPLRQVSGVTYRGSRLFWVMAKRFTGRWRDVDRLLMVCKPAKPA